MYVFETFLAGIDLSDLHYIINLNTAAALVSFGVRISCENAIFCQRWECVFKFRLERFGTHFGTRFGTRSERK